jgi:hypothetical protein
MHTCKSIPLVTAKEDILLKHSPIQKAKENQFSFETVEVKKVSRFGEFKDWNSDEYYVSRTHRDELQEPPVATNMVSCSPCTWG